MTVVRRAGLVLALAGAAVGCARPFLSLGPAPDDGAGPVIASVFLVGDAGSVQPGDRILAELIRQGREAPRSSTVVYLGDNVYPRGIPPRTDPGYPEAERRLFRQAAVADSTGLALLFLPGNHDWDRQGPDGWAQIQREGALLAEYAASRPVRIRLAPAGGCPGPEVVSVVPGLRLVAIDTQWWLHEDPRPGRAPEEYLSRLPDRSVRCQAETEQAFVDALTAVNHDGSGGVSLVVGHHPLESHGEHGGYHPWPQWLFPRVPTPLAGWAWAPIGWLYPLGRRLVSHPQDLNGAANRAMRAAIEGTFAPGSPLAYASGHDHSLEVIRRGSRFLLVSGSGSEHHQSAVGRGDSTAYSASRPGFMRLDLMADERVRIVVTELSGAGRIEEGFRAWLK
ncbi:MAG: metallophosphoesterase [Gemmatimonadales bacterium]